MITDFRINSKGELEGKVIPPAKWEEMYTKDEVAAILTDLQLEIENMTPTYHNPDWSITDLVSISEVNKVIQEKINAQRWCKMGMSIEDIKHCLKVMVDCEVCEECNLYGTTGTDHCEHDCVCGALDIINKYQKIEQIVNRRHGEHVHKVLDAIVNVVED